MRHFFPSIACWEVLLYQHYHHFPWVVFLLDQYVLYHYFSLFSGIKMKIQIFGKQNGGRVSRKIQKHFCILFSIAFSSFFPSCLFLSRKMIFLCTLQVKFAWVYVNNSLRLLSGLPFTVFPKYVIKWNFHLILNLWKKIVFQITFLDFSIMFFFQTVEKVLFGAKGNFQSIVKTLEQVWGIFLLGLLQWDVIFTPSPETERPTYFYRAFSFFLFRHFMTCNPIYE